MGQDGGLLSGKQERDTPGIWARQHTYARVCMHALARARAGEEILKRRAGRNTCWHEVSQTRGNIGARPLRFFSSRASCVVRALIHRSVPSVCLFDRSFFLMY